MVTKTRRITSFIFLGIVIQPLTLSDASMVNDLWEYNSPITLYEIMYEIEHFSTYGMS